MGFERDDGARAVHWVAVHGAVDRVGAEGDGSVLLQCDDRL